MKRDRVFAVIIVLLFVCSFTYAAPAGNTSDPKIPYGDGVANLKSTIGAIKVSIDAEHIDKRELKGASGNTDAELSGQWYLARFGYPLFDNVLEPYLKIGASHIKTNWKDSAGTVIKMKGDNALAWGIGARFLAYEIPQYRVKFVLDGQYRSTDPDVDNVMVTVAQRTVSSETLKIHEWQIGGIVSLEFPLGNQKGRYILSDIFSIIPYVGIAYADNDITSKFTYNAVSYDLGDNGKAKNKAVIITGCDLVCPKNVSVNVEGRLVGETSISGGGTIKF